MATSFWISYDGRERKRNIRMSGKRERQSRGWPLKLLAMLLLLLLAALFAVGFMVVTNDDEGDANKSTINTENESPTNLIGDLPNIPSNLISRIDIGSNDEPKTDSKTEFAWGGIGPNKDTDTEEKTPRNCK